jgi:hypothetical protein
MIENKYEIDPIIYHEIEKLIHSDENPVGIDAKHTHILIMSKLLEISDRIKLIEDKLKNKE